MSANAVSRKVVAGGREAMEKVLIENRFSLIQANGGRKPAPQVHLTGRQLEVLVLLCEGLPNKLICRRLDIAAGTVKAHISSILRELGVASRLQAVVAARRLGLLDRAPADDAPGEVEAADENCEDVQTLRSMGLSDRGRIN